MKCSYRNCNNDASDIFLASSGEKICSECCKEDFDKCMEDHKKTGKKSINRFYKQNDIIKNITTKELP